MKYSEFLVAYAARHIRLLSLVETALQAFVLDPSATRRMLPAMRSEDRRFAHDLATHYGVKTESIDPEPHRSVVIFRQEFPPSRIPKPLLSEVVHQASSEVLVAHQEFVVLTSADTMASASTSAAIDEAATDAADLLSLSTDVVLEQAASDPPRSSVEDN